MLEAGRANLGAVCSNAELPGAFFRQQWGRPELAATSLTIKRNRRWPLCAAFTALFRADLSSLFSNVIGLLNFIIFKLQTIHPNPGPHRRDKSDEGRSSRMERKKLRRQMKRLRVQELQATYNESSKKKIQEFRVITWNVQKMSLGSGRDTKARAAAEIARNYNFDIVLLSEVRADNYGIEYFGLEDKQVVIIFSLKAAIMLRGNLLKLWIECGQQKKMSERCVSIKIGKVSYTATYQPVYHHDNQDVIELAKDELNEHVQWCKSDEILVVGGDFNAHIGGGEDSRNGTCGKFGLRRTNQQGSELLDFCEDNNLSYCNSFYAHKNRGTWFSNFNKSWYELDGFLLRKDQRHKNIRKMCTLKEISLSDHKPKMMIFKCWMKKFGINDKKTVRPRINHEKLRQEETAMMFKLKVRQILNEEAIANDDLEEDEEKDESWSKVVNLLNNVALETCGEVTKSVENPWMVEKEDEIKEMRTRISNAVINRNRIMEQGVRSDLDADLLTEYREELKDARKVLKKSSRRWEKEYWDSILTECEKAGERGDSGTVYRKLKDIGKRGTKLARISTKITSEEFRNHFMKVSETRFENEPDDIKKFLDEVEDLSNTEEGLHWRDVLDATPDKEEVVKQISKMNKDSAPGEDQIRLSYILLAGDEVMDMVVKIVANMFENPSELWEDDLKTGLVIPLHKKGDRDNPNNFRGICLLSMGSRILARVLADRIRIWAEHMELVDDEQAGFRKERSTADATQVMMRIQEDSVDLRKRKIIAGEEIDEDLMPAARLLDLRKAYPRVNRPALWGLLKKYGMGEKCLKALQGLHEETNYKIKSREGTSEPWIPLRGLREGCPSSPPLFNIFHQAPMRTASRRRKEIAATRDEDPGLVYSFVPGSNFPNVKLWESHNSEAKKKVVDKGLFADDTAGVGKQKELETGITIMKEEMARIEEMNNEDKEEILIFGTEEGNAIRMLGSYIGDKVDLAQRKKRGNLAWIKVKRQLKHSKMSKKIQARVVEAVVESTMLFDCNVRVWYIRDIKKMQSQVDKMYRYIWSSKKQPPLMQMQEDNVNMQDIRNKLGIKSMRWKIEKRVLQRIGHVFRMQDDRLVKNVTLGWLTDLEAYPKIPGKKRKTVLYWKRLVKEAGLDSSKMGQLTQDRKVWRSLINERMKYLEEWERKGAKSFQGVERGNRNIVAERDEIFTCDYCQKSCRSKAGLIAHIRTMHEVSKEKQSFKCDRCELIFTKEANLVNHKKICGGMQATQPGRKKCQFCLQEVSAANFARHRRNCKSRHQDDNLEEGEGATAVRVRGQCDECGVTLLKSNIARHKNESCPMRRVVP